MKLNNKGFSVINNKGFSVIEVLIGILIFSMGLTGIYAIILSTMNLNDYSKNSIIATNLAGESINDIRNLRDNNYKGFYKWDKMPGNSSPFSYFDENEHYKVENNFDPSKPKEYISMDKINSFEEGKDKINKMESYRLCLNDKNLYTYNCTGSNKKTYFYRYIKFSKIKDEDGITDINGLKLVSKVIWVNRGYHEVEVSTILTDYLRQ